jgi:hypothetical protein
LVGEGEGEGEESAVPVDDARATDAPMPGEPPVEAEQKTAEEQAEGHEVAQEVEQEAAVAHYHAEHRMWSDTLSLSADGRFWRSGRGGEWAENAATAGRWLLRGSQLTLCWLKKGAPDALETVDGGRTFTSVKGPNFKLCLDSSDADAPGQSGASVPDWVRRVHSLADYDLAGLEVRTLGVIAAKAAVLSCGSMSEWTSAREARCGQRGVVREASPPRLQSRGDLLKSNSGLLPVVQVDHADGTVNVVFEDELGAWFPYDALETAEEAEGRQLEVLLLQHRLFTPESQWQSRGKNDESHRGGEWRWRRCWRGRRPPCVGGRS